MSPALGSAPGRHTFSLSLSLTAVFQLSNGGSGDGGRGSGCGRGGEIEERKRESRLCRSSYSPPPLSLFLRCFGNCVSVVSFIVIITQEGK